MSLDDMTLTCIHVLNKEKPYEYVPAQPKKNGCESFTCSDCLDDIEDAEPNLRVVHNECFVEARIQEQSKDKKRDRRSLN